MNKRQAKKISKKIAGKLMVQEEIEVPPFVGEPIGIKKHKTIRGLLDFWST